MDWFDLWQEYQVPFLTTAFSGFGISLIGYFVMVLRRSDTSKEIPKHTTSGNESPNVQHSGKGDVHVSSGGNTQNTTTYNGPAFNHQGQAVNGPQYNIADSKPDVSNHQSSSGDRSPNIVNRGNSKVDVHLGDAISSQVNVGKIINNYGISLENHEAALKKREHEVVERLSNTEPSDRFMREVLEKELNAASEKLSNLNQSYMEELAARKAVENTLKEIQEELPDLQSESALEKLQEGDKEAAKSLFDKVIEKAEQIDELAGKAAYENGRMAKNEIRYLDARDYFQKAVRFQPENSDYNNAVGSILHYLAEYKSAIEYYQLALASDLKTYGEDHPSVVTVHSRPLLHLLKTSDLSGSCENFSFQTLGVSEIVSLAG